MPRLRMFRVGDKVCLKPRYYNRTHFLGRDLNAHEGGNLYRIVEIMRICTRAENNGPGCPERRCRGYLKLEQIKTGLHFTKCTGFNEGNALEIADMKKIRELKRLGLDEISLNSRDRFSDSLKFDINFQGRE